MLNRCFKTLALSIVVVSIVACSSASKKPVIVIEKTKNELPVLTESQKNSYHEAVKYMASQQYAQAETIFNDLIKQQPRLTGAFVNLGIIRKNDKDLEKAKQFFIKALEINPNFIDALLQQALIHRDAGAFSEAEDLLRRAEAIEPKHALVNYNLGVLYELYLQDYSLAIKYYERYVSVSTAEDVETVKRWIQLLERK